MVCKYQSGSSVWFLQYGIDHTQTKEKQIRIYESNTV